MVPKSSLPVAVSDNNRAYAAYDTANDATAESDRRSGTRIRTVYRIAPIAHGDECGLARVRNISDGGMRIETPLNVMLGDRVSIALAEDQIVGGTIVWTNGSECGVKFEQPINSIAALRLLAEEARQPGYRAPRVPLDTPAVVSSEVGLRAARVRDISQRGMKIKHDGSFAPGLPVKVTLTGGTERRGVIRWSRDGMAGILLTETFSIRDLGAPRSL